MSLQHDITYIIWYKLETSELQIWAWMFSEFPIIIIDAIYIFIKN